MSWDGGNIGPSGGGYVPYKPEVPSVAPAPWDPSEPFKKPDAPSIVPPAPPPVIASPTMPDPAPAITKAETDEDKRGSHGWAANILTSPSGLSEDPPVSRNILLGA